MSRTLALRLVALLLGCLMFCAGASAAPPWSRLISLEKVDADPSKDYVLTEQNGPWMILACSFSGDGADEQARQLVIELRKRYKLEAYTHKMQFEFGQTVGRGLDRFGGPLRMRHRLEGLDETAVLVGNYPSIDDPVAQRTLQTLKYAQPECLKVGDGSRTNQSLAGWRLAQRKLQEAIGSEQKAKGPMGHAFLTTNPLLPDEQVQPGVVDELVVEMNREVPYSLLDCPGRYTVQVATFKGNIVYDQRQIQALEAGADFQSKLAEAAMQAHKLTEALRLKGYEAYEFHDRNASIVTVGSFESVGVPRADGRIEINPKIHAIMKTFAAEPVQVPGQAGTAYTVKSLVGIPFDIQPMPVHVPRRPGSSPSRGDGGSDGPRAAVRHAETWR